jgi:hypothetical protein
MNKNILAALLIFIVITPHMKGQLSNDLPYRNAIKYNISAPLVWGAKNFILEYERVFSPTSSASLSIGYRTLPKLIGIGKSDSALIVRDHINKGGLCGSLDYRFYLKNENKYPAPRGIYLGPYLSYFSTKVKNTFSTYYVDAGSFTATSSMQVFNGGFQLGYQFVFFDRLSLDICFVGPSISWYNFAMKFDASLNLDESDFFNELEDFVADEYPVINLLMDGFTIDGKGRSSKLFYGYRYYFTLGFLF